MSRVKVGRPHRPGLLRRPAERFSVGLMLLFLLFMQHPGRGQDLTEGGLTFFKNYFITGDYVAAGTSLWYNEGPTASGDITIGGVPEDADILAAFLYVQTAEADEDPGSGIAGATFNGFSLDSGDESIAKALNISGVATCFAEEGVRLTTYRADVLRFLPIDDGQHVVNQSHSVTVPASAYYYEPYPRPVGASMVVVYRDPAKPFTGIVIYDGTATVDLDANTLSQTVEGFYEASNYPIVKMTHIVGDGDDDPEQVLLNGEFVEGSPFEGDDGTKWDTRTFSELELAGGDDATITVAPDEGEGGSDCLSYSAIIFSTTVKDSDGDGLIDRWEESGTVDDPNGQALPNLYGMGARPNVKDLFVEIGFMRTTAPVTYGVAGLAKTEPTHSHLPTYAALKLVGDAFKNAPERINLHFDVGSNYQNKLADGYIIPANLARGGESILEAACNSAQLDCQYPAYPGTVGWKTGFRFHRDELIRQPALTFPEICEAPGNDGPGEPCERRFDRNRKDIFHYGLFVHALGLPKSEDEENPDFHVPRTNSGIGDFPGGDFMVALGGFDDAQSRPVGTPFMQGSTLMHELGHNLELRHGGDPFEPNCKSNYLSTMNYLFQLRGLIRGDGSARMDFSDRVIVAFSELSPPANLGNLPYRTSWYAPKATSYLQSLGTTAAKRHCDGSELTAEEIANNVQMVRIDGTATGGRIDWNADGRGPDQTPQDINFSGTVTPLNDGFDDWASIRLNQIGARRNVGALYLDDDVETVGPLSLDAGRGDLGRGDLGRGDLGRGDLGRGDLGRGDLGRGDLGRGDLGQVLTLGRGDLGRGDLGRGDLGVGADDEPIGDLDFETAAALGDAPSGLTAVQVKNGVQLSWQPPNLGGVFKYLIYRVDGATVTASSEIKQVGVVVATAPGQAPALTKIDNSAKRGVLYTYFVIAEYDDGPPRTQSGPSNFVTIMGK